MDSLQPQTIKIKKEPREQQQRNCFEQYVCGCSKKYGSYPALYLHIRRKHNGIRPPNTLYQKPKLLIQRQKSKIGRPKKPLNEQNEIETPIESAQNELLIFLGQELEVIRDVSHKESLKDIMVKVLSLKGSDSSMDTWSEDLQKESLVFLSKNNERDLNLENPDFEEDLIHLDPKNGLSVIVWFMMWLAKLYVKSDFIPDLCLIFSRIWKILDMMQLRVADLDNKLVWKRICTESEGLIFNLDIVHKDLNLLNELIKKVCCIIGMIFENRV